MLAYDALIQIKELIILQLNNDKELEWNGFISL
jgi:hypothetical protein